MRQAASGSLLLGVTVLPWISREAPDDPPGVPPALSFLLLRETRPCSALHVWGSWRSSGALSFSLKVEEGAQDIKTIKLTNYLLASSAFYFYPGARGDGQLGEGGIVGRPEFVLTTGRGGREGGREGGIKFLVLVVTIQITYHTRPPCKCIPRGGDSNHP